MPGEGVSDRKQVLGKRKYGEISRKDAEAQRGKSRERRKLLPLMR